MARTDLKLIGAWTSPFVMRVRVALNIKSLNYEYLEETSITAKSELLLKSNPIHKKIPVLIHGDNPICESLIIVEYIDEVWSSSPSILPAHPYDRATARFWVDLIDNKNFHNHFNFPMEDLKLLGAWTSPFTSRVRIALNIKSIPYEYLEQSIIEKSEILLKSNPIHKKVPVLIHGDNRNPICESLVIVEYIDEAFPSSPSILPADPYDRAIARFWAKFVDDKIFGSIVAISIVEDGFANKAAISQMEEGMMLLEEAFGKISKGKGFFGGDGIGFLDVVFGCLLGWLRVTEEISGVKFLDEAKTPALFGWSERFSDVPAVKGLIQDTEKLVEFAKVLQKAFKGK